MSKSKVPGGANGAWADAHLDDVSAGKDERLHHVASNDVPGLKGGKRINNGASKILFRYSVIFFLLSQVRLKSGTKYQDSKFKGFYKIRATHKTDNYISLPAFR